MPLYHPNIVAVSFPFDSPLFLWQGIIIRDNTLYPKHPKTLNPKPQTLKSTQGEGNMGGCQNYGALLGSYYNTASNI